MGASEPMPGSSEEQCIEILVETPLKVFKRIELESKPFIGVFIHFFSESNKSGYHLFIIKLFSCSIFNNPNQVRNVKTQNRLLFTFETTGGIKTFFDSLVNRFNQNKVINVGRKSEKKAFERKLAYINIGLYYANSISPSPTFHELCLNK